MKLGLEGKTAVVTGGTSGIGLATVRVLLEEGARVAFCARNPDRIVELSGAFSAEFGIGKVLAVPCDVTKPEQVAFFAGHVGEVFGAVDCLVNNAGQGRVSTFATTTDDAWREELELKFFSQIHMVRAFEPHLRKSAHPAVIAVNSLLALQPEAHMVATSAARAGVQSLIKSLAKELAPQIRVNSILLGLVDSGQWQRRFAASGRSEAERAAWYAELALEKGIPLQRLGEPEEVARAIVFLGSPAASYITGAKLEISGGVSKSI